MVVDDDPGILYTVRTVLMNSGYEVWTASNGAQCIEQLKNGFSGLILLDIMMPDQDGWSTIRQIHEEQLDGRTLICMLTAKQDPDAPLDELKESVLEYVRKPFTADELVKVVNNYVHLLGGPHE
jgi:CheY-like chemotaxis protein